MLIQFGIVGCGYIAGRHLKHIVDHPGGVVRGIFDIEKSQMHDLAEEYQVEAFLSYEALLACDDIQIVIICTPNGTHAELAEQALKAGKHVLVEKPMAINLADAQRMVQIAHEVDRKLYVVKQNRYNPPVQAVKELIDAKKLGQVYFVSLNCFWNRNDAYYQNSAWKGKKALDGGVLYTQFSHFVDILFYLFGDIDEVRGRIANFGHQQLTEIEDTGTFTFHLREGGMGNLNFTTCAFNQNMEGSITVFAENATIKIGGKYLNTIDYQETNGFDIKHLPASSPANNYGYYQGSMSNHDRVINNVIEALNGREEIMTTGEEGLKVVEMIHQFYQAAE